MFETDTGAKKLAWIEALHTCENRNDIPRILDTNGYYSYAYLMFQKSTFKSFGEQYDLPHDDIYSREQQEMIALYMLNDGLWRHWYTCSNKVTRDLGYSFPVDDPT